MSLKKFAALAVVCSAAGLAAMGASPIAFAMDSSSPFWIYATPQHALKKAGDTIQLTGDQMTTVTDTKKPETYRVCERSGTAFGPYPAVPVRIQSAKRDLVVDPGQCKTVDSRVIKMAPAGWLESDEALQAKLVKTSGPTA